MMGSQKSIVEGEREDDKELREQAVLMEETTLEEESLRCIEENRRGNATLLLTTCVEMEIWETRSHCLRLRSGEVLSCWSWRQRVSVGARGS